MALRVRLWLITATFLLRAFLLRPPHLVPPHCAPVPHHVPLSQLYLFANSDPTQWCALTHAHHPVFSETLGPKMAFTGCA